MNVTHGAIAALLASGITLGLQAADSTCAASAAATVAAKADIVDTAVAAGSFKTLAAALQAADLIPALKGEGPFTVFAPTDEAFAKLPKGTVASLLEPKAKGTLTSILTYHVVPGRVLAKDVVTRSSAITLNGQQIEITTGPKGVMIDGAKVLTTDILCTNGVIHVIDAVILPSTQTIVDVASEAGSFNTLLAAAQAAGLADLLQSDGPFTLLAPTDEAFAKLPAGTVANLLKPENRAQLAAILKLHVVPGRVYARDAIIAGNAASAQGGTLVFGIRDGRIDVNGATILKTDVEARNGVIHVIDRVILPAS